MNKVEPILDVIDKHNYLASEHFLIYWLNLGIDTRNNIVDSASLRVLGEATGEIPDDEDYEIILELDKQIENTCIYLNT